MYDMYGSSESEQTLAPGELLPLGGGSELLDDSGTRNSFWFGSNRDTVLRFKLDAFETPVLE